MATVRHQLALLCQQFADRLRIVEQVLRAAVEVGQRGGGIDAQHVIDRRHEVLEGDRARRGAFRPAVGLADDLAHLQTAAGQEHAAGLGPVLAAGMGRAELGRAAEFAEHHHQHVVAQAALLQSLTRAQMF